jgi:hypothetical protein
MGRRRFRIRYADVAATLALVLAGGGTAYAAGALPRGSVGTTQLKADAVTVAKLHHASVTSDKLAKGAVRSAALADGSVTLSDLAGTDVSGAISVSIAANSCINLSLGVKGAKPGQVAVFAWRGSANPDVLMTGPARVSGIGAVAVPMCNVSTSSVTVSDAPVRVITLD